tara:strand:- start:1195 stop:1854 length:660 start_codon:yes stop_codon:yes gene_type:complete
MSDLLVYGNLDQENLKYLNVKNIFTSKKDLFLNNKFPDYDETKLEIAELIKLQNAYDKGEYSKDKIQFYKDADDGLELLFSKYLPACGVNMSKTFTNKLFDLTDQTGALIMQLKNSYQRPRPYQVAFYSEQKLHPRETLSGHSPSYPSGHACQAHFLTAIIAMKFPDKKELLKEFASGVARSRLRLGLHYPSDNVFGKKIAYDLLKMPDVKQHIKTMFF